MASVIQRYQLIMKEHIMSQPKAPENLEEAIRMVRIQQMSKQHGATTGHSVEAELRIRNMLQETRGLSPETVPNQT